MERCGVMVVSFVVVGVEEDTSVVEEVEEWAGGESWVYAVLGA